MAKSRFKIVEDSINDSMTGGAEVRIKKLPSKNQKTKMDAELCIYPDGTQPLRYGRRRNRVCVDVELRDLARIARWETTGFYSLAELSKDLHHFYGHELPRSWDRD